MAKESSLWKWLRNIDRSTVHMNRVENSACPGMPDVEGFYYNCSFPDNNGQFWLELKHVKKPVRKSTPIRIRNLRPQQKLWLQKRWNFGACCYLLLQVGSGPSRLIYMIAPPFLDELEKGVSREWLDGYSMLSNAWPTQEHVIRVASCKTTRRGFDKYKVH